MYSFCKMVAYINPELYGELSTKPIDKNNFYYIIIIKIKQKRRRWLMKARTIGTVHTLGNLKNKKNSKYKDILYLCYFNVQK